MPLLWARAPAPGAMARSRSARSRALVASLGALGAPALAAAARAAAATRAFASDAGAAAPLGPQADRIVHLPSAPLGPEADRITGLPGLDKSFAQEMYSGYLDVPGSEGTTKSIFYWFVAKRGGAADAPTVLWTNGGPGCSGLLGFMSEQGPFRPDKDGNLALNADAWTQLANMVFIEQPAGVGFSTVGTDADLTTGDEQASVDAVAAIEVLFSDKFPSLAGNDFYLSSESYGGHYMPWFSRELVRAQAAGRMADLKFTGMLVGNPFSDIVENTYGRYGTLAGHQLVPAPLYAEWEEACKMVARQRPSKCDALETRMDDITEGLNPYALDWPVCLDDERRSVQSLRMSHMLAAARRGEMANAPAYQPCEDNYVLSYLSRDDVRKAIHVKPEANKWEECSDELRYNQSDLLVSSASIYPELFRAGLRVLIYSGDDDSICGGVGTQTWLYGLGKKVTRPWAQWKVAGQVAGYVQHFEGDFAYATVHGAGHEVPAYEPARAYQLLKNFLSGAW